MSTSYPGAIDTLTNPVSTDPLDNPSHADQHANANDAIEAIEQRLGLSGTSFPASPSAGDRFYRTDRRLEYEYDGTRWLTIELFRIAAFGPASSVSTNDDHWRFPLWGAEHQLYVDHITFVLFVATTNDASNFWTFGINRIAPNNAATGLANVATNTDGPNTWLNKKMTVGAVWDGTAHPLVNVNAGKTGAPGNAHCLATIVYRLVG